MTQPKQSPSPSPSDDEPRLARFGAALDRIKADVLADIGDADLAYVRNLDKTSRALEIAGRTLIHFSLDPVTFGIGVTALWLHKQLQATEIGHTVLHGAYDRLGDPNYSSKTFAWDVPIDEEAWRYGHNARHHGATNVAGHDPDIHFGPVRLTDQTPHSPKHRYQLPFALFVMFPNFTFLMNWHFTGLSDAYFDNGLGDGTGTRSMDFLPDREPATIRSAWQKALRKWVPYYAKNYVFYPALAGPFFGKVLLGNWLAETMRDLYSAATIYCGHVGESVKNYPAGTKAKGRGAWYAMQIEATNNFEVPRALSILCGGLDRQIEHHVFPTFAPERLRQVAPAVRAACEEFGVEYKTDSWPATLKKSLKHIANLSKKGGVREVIAAMA